MQQGAREQLAQRLRDLEKQIAQVQSELLGLGPGVSLPGVHLVLEAAGVAATVPAGRVTEIVRLVACAPLPDAPSWVLGTFNYRGEPVVAADLGAYLQQSLPAPAGAAPRVPPLEAHMLVLCASRPVAIVVDRVRTLVDAPTLAEGGAALPGAWMGSPIVAGLCRVGEDLLPVLDFEPLVAALGAERAP